MKHVEITKQHKMSFEGSKAVFIVWSASKSCCKLRAILYLFSSRISWCCYMSFHPRFQIISIVPASHVSYIPCSKQSYSELEHQHLNLYLKKLILRNSLSLKPDTGNQCNSNKLHSYRMGPLRYNLVYKPLKLPATSSLYLPFLATEIRQLNAILGAPSCTYVFWLVEHQHFPWEENKKNDSAMASRPGDVAACRQAALEGGRLRSEHEWTIHGFKI